MACYNHPSMSAAASCVNCGKEICAACITQARGKTVCRDCAEILRSQPAPAAQEPLPEAPAVEEKTSPFPAAPGPVPEAPSAGIMPSPGPAAGEASGVPATIKSSSLAPAGPSRPPAVPDAGAGGAREKESLLSAALSLLLPGAGQLYNGQTVKGVTLAAFYIGSIAIILGGFVATALSISYYHTPRSATCCCMPLFILPMIVLVYAIYDAYNTAEKINDHQAVRDWL